MFFTEIEIGQDLEPHYLKCDFLLLLCISFIMAKPINSLKKKKKNNNKTAWRRHYQHQSYSDVWMSWNTF